jgi:hypothetical protein
VGTISAASFVLPFPANQGPYFTPLAIGQTELTFSAGSIPILPANTLHVNVAGSYAPVAPFSVPSGFESTILLEYLGGAVPRKPVTIKSKDSSRVLLSLDDAKRGSGSVTVPIP